MRNPALLGGLALVLAALALVIAIISLFSAAPEPAAPAPAKSDQPGYTVSLVDRAIDYYQANGRQAALDYYNSPDSVDGRWYVFIYDENNVRVAHPTVKSLLGKPVDGPTGVDLNGYAYGQDMVKTTEAGQWVSYVFLNPSTGREEVKHTWLRKHDGLIFGSGWYEGNHQLPAKSNPMDYTVSLVQQALRRYAREGRQATLDYYNSPANRDGDWYVFVLDAEGRIIAHANPELLQAGPEDWGTDITGYWFADAMLAATEEGHWVDYIFENLNTGNQEYKHSWVIKRDDLIFGSGWYQVLPSSSLAISKSDPAVYTVAYVEQAIRYYQAHGREATVEYYQKPESRDGEWYLFLTDEGLNMISIPIPDLMGKHASDIGETLDGVNFADVEYSEEGGWISYEFLNPATGERQIKHSWIKIYDGAHFGSGWYEPAP